MGELKVATTDGGQTAFDEALIESFRAGLRGDLLLQGHPAYDEARKIHNGMIDRHPALIVRCAGVADVVSAIRFARERNLLLSIRGGGHGVPGFAICDGGLMIDLTRMKSIRAHPWFYRTYIVLARCHAAAGDWTRAIEVVKTSLPLFKGRAFHTNHLATLGYCQARMGNRRGARAVLSEIEALAAKHYCSRLDPALIYHGLRDRDRTAHLIQEAEQDRDPWAFPRRVDPLWRAD